MSASIAWLTRAELAELKRTTPTHITELVVREGLPAHNIGTGERLHLRFDPEEVERWFALRRERQLRALLEGKRYSRRRLVQFDQDRSGDAR